MSVSKHPNGFIVKLLHTFSNGARLRLHRWSKNRVSENDPHDHRTWFISIPLWGIFEEHRYEEIEGDIPIYRCRSTTSKERLDIYKDGQSGLKLVSRKIRLPFIPYFCSMEKIHTFQPLSNGFAASLVLFGPPKNYTPKAWIKKITTQKVQE